MEVGCERSTRHFPMSVAELSRAATATTPETFPPLSQNVDQREKAAFDIDPTISKRADAAKRPPRASKNPRPGTEEHPSGNATRTKERSQTNRTPNRSANKTGTVREHEGSFILAAQER